MSVTNKQELIDRLNANAPAELLALDQWVCWRREKRDGKLTKVPIDANTGKEAKVNGPATWSSFEKAAQTYTGGKFAGGVGFVFTEHDPYTGVDFDKCIGDDGQMEANALAMLQGLASYSERSQSGTGAHVIVRGKLPTTGTGRRKGTIEMYHYARFFVMTGDRLDGTPGEIHERQAELTALYHQVFGAEKATVAAGPGTSGSDLDDGALLQTMFESKNGAHIRGLWDGRTNGYGDDHSAADLALCNHLAYWTNGDAARMGRLFRLSGLYRPKWDERHYADGATYGDATITKALSDFTPQVGHRNGTNGAGYEHAYTGTADALPTDPAADDDEDGDEKPAFKVSLKMFADIASWGFGDIWLSEMDESLMMGNRRFTDADRARLRMIARDNKYGKFKLMGALDDAVLAYAEQHKRHPVREYLAGLEWDGQDHIKRLSAYFTDAHPPLVWVDGKPRSLFFVALFRWLICAVAKQMGDKDASRYNFVMVLSGKQGSGKSHFASWMCPLPEYFVERPVIPGDKDCSLQRARAMVWEIGELGATTRRADVEALKAHITQATVSERAAYGRFDTVRPAVASYIGTVNPDGAGFLTDSTGNRRFAVLDISAIDWKYADDVDVNQVWAQAVAAWNLNPKAYRMSTEESAAFDANAKDHLEPDIFADALAQVFEIDPAQTGEDWRINSMQLLEKLRTLGGVSRGHDKAQAREVARALKAHWGIMGFRSNGTTFYRGLRNRYEGGQG